MREATAGRFVVVLVWYLISGVDFSDEGFGSHTRGSGESLSSTSGSETAGILLGCTETKLYEIHNQEKAAKVTFHETCTIAIMTE